MQRRGVRYIMGAAPKGNAESLPPLVAKRNPGATCGTPGKVVQNKELLLPRKATSIT
jgi:hypothetical protein